MQFAVLAGFALAALAPQLNRLLGGRAGLLLALYPAGVFVWLLSHLADVMAGQTFLYTQAWAPDLGLSLTFMLDGLSLLFGLMISGIGTFILLYAHGYLHGHKDQVRFYVLILMFMSSMLGVVLSDSLITLYVFWELTSITSYMLIGFDHTNAEARKSALQGLLVTFIGGLALMAGMIMLNIAGGSWSLSELLTQGDILREHPLYTAMLLCLLVGAFTKSAQFPFHFWLPNAMAAPTPVSAYLHSATMVKAGIYLLARLSPGLGDTALWTGVLSLVGALTMFTGALMAIRYSGIKKLLAYSTVMALGVLTMLLGIGTQEAIIACVTFMLAHSLYKGALFMVAGNLDHETGTKDVEAMGGLRRAMPLTALAASVAALSLGGIIPLFGFVAKELMFEAVLGAPMYQRVLVVLALATSVLVVAVAAIVALKPFFGAFKETPKRPQEAPFCMLAGPLTLAGLSLAFGLAPGLAGQGMLQAAASAIDGQPVEMSLSLWHGINPALMMSLFSLVAGLLIFWRWAHVRRGLGRFDSVFSHGPEWGYFRLFDGMVNLAEWQTRLLQNGYIRNYLLMTLLTFIGLTGYTLLFRYSPTFTFPVDAAWYEVLVALLMCGGAIAASLMRSRLAAVVAAGIMGFSIALIFILFSAPDLGITQLLVETLTAILLVLVLFRLPRFASLSRPMERVRDLIVAGAMGTLMTLLILVTIDVDLFPSISQYMIDNSATLGHGLNMVNVILVDFRSLDTLGEMFVLALAAIGAFAMLKLRVKEAPHG